MSNKEDKRILYNDLINIIHKLNSNAEMIRLAWI